MVFLCMALLPCCNWVNPLGRREIVWVKMATVVLLRAGKNDAHLRRLVLWGGLLKGNGHSILSWTHMRRPIQPWSAPCVMEFDLPPAPLFGRSFQFPERAGIVCLPMRSGR